MSSYEIRQPWTDCTVLRPRTLAPTNPFQGTGLPALGHLLGAPAAATAEKGGSVESTPQDVLAMSTAVTRTAVRTDAVLTRTGGGLPRAWSPPV